jgi:hypothetical protein
MKEEYVFLILLALLAGGVGYLILHSSGSPLVPVTGTRYQNKEEWEIVRDGKDRITKIIIHRDAHTSG